MTTNQKPRVHFAPPEFLNPTNPITINIIGAGGTGCHLLSAIAKINHCLMASGHCGFSVQLFDGDIITPANRGRQLFTESEIGVYKSVVLINRVNRFWGTNWKAMTVNYDKQYFKTHRDRSSAAAVITVGCVDNVQARFEICKFLTEIEKKYWNYSHNKPTYYYDFGNSRHTGQVILSTLSKVEQPKSEKYQPVANLPLITEEYGQLLKDLEKEDDTPSCSLPEALKKQDLFINPSLVEMGGSLLWNFFLDGMIFHKGLFHNIKTFNTTGIPV
jgi:PRTRC genetic system ThiF family protein